MQGAGSYDLNYIEIAKRFETVEKEEIAINDLSTIDTAVKALSTQRFDQIDPNIRNNEKWTHMLVAKVLAEGDAALLSKLPSDLLGKEKIFLEEWENSHHPASIQPPSSSKVEAAKLERRANVDAFLAKIDAISTASEEGINALWRLFDEPESAVFKNNREVALALVKKDGNLLGRLHQFENDLEVVVAAINRSPNAFRFAGPEIRNDGAKVYQFYKHGYNVLPFAGTEALMQISKEHPGALAKTGDQRLLEGQLGVASTLIYGLYEKAKRKEEPVGNFFQYLVKQAPDGEKAAHNRLFDALRSHPDMLKGILEWTEATPEFIYQAAVIALARDASLQEILPEELKNDAFFANAIEQERTSFLGK